MTETEQHSVSQEAAKAIYQDALDALSKAVMAYDTDTLTDRIGFPFRMSTLKREFVIENEADWLQCARGFHQNLTSMGVNHFIRLVTEADFLSENYIEGRHVTHTMRNALALVPPYENRTTLTRSNGQWRVTQMDSAIQNDRWPISMPKVDVTTKTHLPEADPISDARRSGASPMALYQEYLDALTQTNMEDDFDGWCAMCDFPHTVHIEHVDEVIERPEQIKPFFEMFNRLIAQHKIDAISRSAEYAEFLSSTQICGYHQTTLSSKGELKVGPVASRYILNRTGTTWRMVSVTNSIANAAFPYSLPELSNALISLRDIQERTTRQ